MEVVMSLLLMLGGVAVFLYGMKLMSSGIEQSAGSGTRKLFKRIGKNRFADYGTGILTTAIVQSSSATSIMTIGLANAKIVDVKQGSGIILGAKVGTTLTAFIFAMSGISKGAFSIGTVFASVAFVGVIISMVTSNDFLKKLALFLTGFGLLFLGLEVMEASIGGSGSVLRQEVSKLLAYDAMQNPVLLVIVGIIFTCIIQSSTAATGIFIVLLQSGVIGSIDQSFFLVMGANIGTCADGVMASFGSNVYGKRIALFHVLTSTMGALLFSVILAIFRSPITQMFEKYIAKPEWSLAIFNLSYNTIYTLILLAVLKPLVTLVNKTIKDKPEKHNLKLKYIDERLLTTPTVAIEQALKEIYDMAMLAQENLTRSLNALLDEDMTQGKKVAEDEYQIDYTTRELASFFIKVSSTSISSANERLVGGLHHVISDIERIGDHAVLFAKETSFMSHEGLSFNKTTRFEIKKLYAKINYLYSICLETFKARKIQRFNEISTVHKDVLKSVNEARDAHISRLNGGEYSVEVSKTLYAVFLSMQRVSDHLVNIAFSIRSNTGSKTEAFEIIGGEKNKRS